MPVAAVVVSWGGPQEVILGLGQACQATVCTPGGHSHGGFRPRLSGNAWRRTSRQSPGGINSNSPSPYPLPSPPARQQARRTTGLEAIRAASETGIMVSAATAFGPLVPCPGARPDLTLHLSFLPPTPEPVDKVALNRETAAAGPAGTSTPIDTLRGRANSTGEEGFGGDCRCRDGVAGDRGVVWRRRRCRWRRSGGADAVGAEVDVGDGEVVTCGAMGGVVVIAGRCAGISRWPRPDRSPSVAMRNARHSLVSPARCRSIRQRIRAYKRATLRPVVASTSLGRHRQLPGGLVQRWVSSSTFFAAAPPVQEVPGQSRRHRVQRSPSPAQRRTHERRRGP